MKLYNLLFGVFVSLILLVSCQKTTETEVKLVNAIPYLNHYDYKANIEARDIDHWKFNNAFSNPLSNASIELGKVLFYDTKLSLNSSISCNTCHLQEHAFGDNRSSSFGFKDDQTPRNSPTIQNLGTSKVFFWDMSKASLEDQVLVPFMNHIEMGIPSEEYLVEKVEGLSYYQKLFSNAYGNSKITSNKISRALAQFVKSIVTNNSKFDNLDSNPLNVEESLGKAIFEESCNKCHNVITTNFGGGDFPTGGDNPYTGGSSGDAANIGLDKSVVDEGAGEGRFKIPSLRNLLFSAPYMHDGRFATLDQVIEHYNSGVEQSPFLDFRLREQPFSPTPQRLGLNNQEKAALKAFLLTLTDPNFVSEPMYKNPFVY